MALRVSQLMEASVEDEKKLGRDSNSFNYLCTCRLYGPGRNDCDGGKSNLRAIGRGGP
jgi:hypothetical protein